MIFPSSARLRAQGGFLISAKKTKGVIGDLQIESTAGGEVKFVNPWPGSALRVTEVKTGRRIALSEAKGIATFATQANEKYAITK